MKKQLSILISLFLICSVFSSCAAEVNDTSSDNGIEGDSRSVYDYCITTGEALDHVGEEVDVAGFVVSWSAPGIAGDPLFINLDYDYPDDNRLQVVMWGDTREGYYDDIGDRLLGKTVVVHGVIENYEGVAQITFDENSYIENEDEFLDSIE